MMHLINGILLAVLTCFVSCNETTMNNGELNGDTDSTFVGPIYPVDFDADYIHIESGSFVQDKNFYFLTVLLKLDIISENSDIFGQQADLLSKKIQLINYAVANNNWPANVLSSYFKFSDQEIHEIGLLFQNEVESNEAWNQVVQEHLRPSGYFELYSDLTDGRLVYFAWRDAAYGINNIFREYLEGETPQDEVSDGPLYNLESETYLDSLRKIVNGLGLFSDGYEWFFEPSLSASIAILNLNGRDEAGRFERLSEGRNKTTIAQMQNVDFDDFEYGAIILLGDSPNSPGDAENISKGAITRIGIAVDQYLQGLAPFIMICGANVFPNHTPYHEAIEMKNWMVSHDNIPDEVIFIEPHSRHTTTNLRNASRLLLKYKFPIDKKYLVTTTEGHCDYVMSNRYQTRNTEILGYVPVQLDQRISKFSAEFFINGKSLQIASEADPLDP